LQFSREAKQTIRTQANRQDKGSKKNVPCNSRAVYSGGTASFADANGKRQNYGFLTRGIAAFWWQKVANTVFDCCSLPLFGRQKAAQKPTRRQKRLKDAA